MTEPYAPHWSLDAMRADVAAGLAKPQKELPPKYFYDTRGSRLFEEITGLEEYYPTRAERCLLLEAIPPWIDQLRPRALIELGAGSAEKTRIIIEAMLHARRTAVYVPVDIARDFLQQVADELQTEYAALSVDPVVADITRPLEIGGLPHPVLFALLGSTIGNFRPAAADRILAQVVRNMEEDDRFLLGLDLKKEVAVIEAAYNDRRGITARFNLNMLRVLNRELGADFDLDAFRHHAFYDPERNRIEMHLVSTRPQSVRLPELGTYEIGEGESIRTELSHKYDRSDAEAMFERAGLRLERWITDDAGLFGLAVGASP